ncbi:TetR/AcrR family transcriptional regulator [Sphaerisporangium corydalis]|uniref:Helix-turn-helix domain-containing protein n=1 Tax=Sphaerisporangium corydalis TaxID=1441875 RepID=A0ABV9EKH5_9ACTN|nr:TetR/AcrR family transcriptional regulator [Sphaerisporangium corydalis]
MSGNGDRRVRRSRRAVQQALIELILERGYDRVSVTEIIDRADVGRSTFYAHFTGKQAVLAANLDDLSDTLRHGPGGAPLDFSLPMLEHIAGQRRLVRALLGRRGGAVVMAQAERTLAEIVRAELLAALPAGAPPPGGLEVAVMCVVGAFMTMLRTWVEGDLTATPAELDTAFRALLLPGLTTFLRQPAPDHA